MQPVEDRLSSGIGVRVVHGGGAGDHGFGRVPPFGFTGLAPTICGRGYDGDELAEEVAFGAQVGGPLGGTGNNYQ